MAFVTEGILLRGTPIVGTSINSYLKKPLLQWLEVLARYHTVSVFVFFLLSRHLFLISLQGVIREIWSLMVSKRWPNLVVGDQAKILILRIILVMLIPAIRRWVSYNVSSKMMIIRQLMPLSVITVLRISAELIMSSLSIYHPVFLKPPSRLHSLPSVQTLHL